VSAELYPALVRLARLDWRAPVDRIVANDLPGIFDALVGRYRAPAWLYGALAPRAVLVHGEALWMRFVEVGACLSRGGSYRDVEHMLPGQLTRRVFANLVASDQADPMLALREAQVRAFGGPSWLAQALVRHYRYNDDLRYSVLPILPWLCRNAEPTELDHVLAFLRNGVPDLAGRTWASVRRLAEQGRSTAQPLDRRPLPRSGFGEELSACWEGWRLRELRTPLEIFVEGNVMRHCVATYIPHVRAGGTSIWSFRQADARSLTVEVRNATREIVQVRGRGNRLATPEEKKVLHSWARTNDLVVVDVGAR
jgi:hypothetical protein